MGKNIYYVSLVWKEYHSVYCELKKDKKGLQAEESWWRDNRSKNKNQNETETEIWIEKDGLKTRRLKIRLENSRNILV